MALKDMKLDAKAAKETMLCCAEPETPMYPYGLRLCLDDDTLEKLGITSLPEVGIEVAIMAKATVVEVEVCQSQDGETHREMDLQITKLDVEVPGMDRTAAGILYGG